MGGENMKIVRVLILTVFSILGMIPFIDDVNVRAEDTDPPLRFEPIYPENHNPQTKGYFDLSVKSGEQHSLKVRITNDGANEALVRMEAVNAYTNPAGGMMYVKDLDTTDSTLLDDAVQLADSIKIEETIMVPPQSSVEVPIELTVPKTDGEQILGGILFITQSENIEEQQEVEEGTANFVLKTETVYAMAVQLNLPNEVPDHFSYGTVDFNGERAQVQIEMTNAAQKIQEGIEGEYVVSDDNGNELFRGEFGPFKMAPKSKIRFPVNWTNETLEDGKYTVALQGNAGENEATLSEDFTIQNKDVQDYVEKTQPTAPQAQVKSGIPIWVWVFAAIAFGVGMFFIGKRRPS